MVVGMLLYETVDLTYNVICLGYNSMHGLYNWYYQVDAKEKQHEHEEKVAETLRQEQRDQDTTEMIHQLKILNERVEKVEHMLAE
tara:strand:+ start:439 stop:693 length:255 start_codon:yes stop_codon:yes gene_type:complete